MKTLYATMVGLCFVSNTEKEQIFTKMAIYTKGNGNWIKCTVMEFIHTLTEECEYSSLNWLSPKPVIVYWYNRICLLKQGSNQDATSHVNNAMQLSVTKTSHASSQLPIRFEFSKAKVFNIDIETLRNHLHLAFFKTRRNWNTLNCVIFLFFLRHFLLLWGKVPPTLNALTWTRCYPGYGFAPFCRGTSFQFT